MTRSIMKSKGITGKILAVAVALLLWQAATMLLSQEFLLASPLTIDKDSEEFLVPAKSLLSKIGGTLVFDETDGLGRADISFGQNTVSVWAYDTHAIVNGGYHKLPTHPRLTEDKVLIIPVSLFSDVFGADIEFKEGISSLSIIY